MNEIIRLSVPEPTLDHIEEKTRETFAKATMNLMNLSGVDIGRATHYNTKEDAENARSELHRELFILDRTIYGMSFCLDGVTDFARQKAIKVLLSNPWNENTKPTWLTMIHERKIIDYLVSKLKPFQAFNIFLEMKEDNVNNARTVKTIMRYIINSRNLDYWAVKYRRKLELLFKYCWSEKNAGIIKVILTKNTFDESERRGLKNHITKYSRNQSMPKIMDIFECVSFILGNDIEKPRTSTIKSYEESKTDIEKGKLVPKEILYQVRSTFHLGTSTKADVLRITEKTMTSKETMKVQKSAKKAGTKVAFNPKDLPMIDLLIYSYEMGPDKKILEALEEKAKKAAKALPFTFNNIGILVDTSYSMVGSTEGTKLRPIATALALQKMLSYAGTKSTTVYCGPKPGLSYLVFPAGETNLADGFMDVIEKEPDSVFIISDGYENAPEGRLTEVIELVNGLGWNLPIYHLNPVSAAESKAAVKSFGKNIPVMSVFKPEAMGLTLLKRIIEQDPIRGIISILKTTIPLISWKEGN